AFRGKGPFTLRSSKSIAFASSWLHFLEVSHSSGRLFPGGFRRGRRSRCGAFAVGLALDDELVSAVAEAVQSALAQHRVIKDRHPFVDTSVGGDDRRTASVPFDQQLIEVGSGLAGKLLQSKIIYDQ